MLVYGDRSRRLETARAIGDIEACLAEASARPPGLARHAKLVEALIDAGALAQGILDHAFEAAGGVDADTPAGDAAMAVVQRLAEAVLLSWQTGFAAKLALDGMTDPLRISALPDSVVVRQPEGFAFYALYPELHGEAAAASAGIPTQVLGLRSVGTTLGAMVAAGAGGGGAGAATARPVGHPFTRELSLSDDLRTRLATAPRLAVVDEGPGLSGSSMAAAAALAPDLGRVVFFPGHLNGPGPRSSHEVRAIWSRVKARVTTFEDAILGAADARHRLETWVADLVGPLSAPLRDISGGGWRATSFGEEGSWPPVLGWAERRKFLAETPDGTWLVKFAGLGRPGRDALARARRLAEAGFGPEPAGLCHGFLVQRWLGASHPLDPARPDLADEVGRYLAFRAEAFPAADGTGASLDELARMARHNTREALGEDAEQALAARLGDPARLRGRARPVETDNRLHLWEWRVDGARLVKTDALDHHAGHDLVGCQDVAWDVVGAAVELGLDPREVIGATERAGATVDREIVAFLHPCYLAFQLGFWSMALDGADGAERSRVAGAVRRYGDALAAVIDGPCAPRRGNLL